MNKKRTFAVLTALIMVAIGVVTFNACKKNESINTTAIKKPIAVKNANNDEIIYNVPLSRIQDAVDKYTSSKNIGDVIIESWNIVDGESCDSPILMLSLIEIESESSSKIAMYNTFVERIINGNSIEYYLSNLICSGNYNYITSDSKDTYLVTVENNEVVSVEPYTAKSSWTGGESVTCKTTACASNDGCSVTDNKNCSPCWGDCTKETTKTYVSQCLTAFK